MLRLTNYYHSLRHNLLRLRYQQVTRLHLGCGQRHLANWLNIDLDSPQADLRYNLLQPWPFADQSIDYIFSEHLLEHFNVNQGLIFLREAYRVLKPGGIIRTATPDLDHLVKKYTSDWKNQPWIKDFDCEWIQTKAEMMNMMFHWWGHQYLYNEEELRRWLTEAGFKKLTTCTLKKSKHAALKNLESRPDSRLIIEASK